MIDVKDWTPRPPVVPVTLVGRFVTILPYDAAEHLEALWLALGEQSTNQLLRYFAAPDFANADDFGRWLEAVKKAGWVTHVFRDNATGTIRGMANYMRTDAANGVTEVGGVAHGPAMKRTALATEVHYLMARHVFEDLDYRRYEWKCDNRNEASKVTAIRYGFTFEGVFRQHMLSRGENRDTAWFSMIDCEWPRLKAAFEAWLSPDNFHADGSQIRRLEDIRASLP